MAQSESSKMQNEQAAAELSERLGGITVALGFSEEMGIWTAEAFVDGDPVCQGRGISPMIALRNLERSYRILVRSQGAGT
jgi:hypothetical protein